MSHIIMDTSVVRLNAKHVLEEGLFFNGFNNEEETWCRKYTDAKTYESVHDAIKEAKKIKSEKLPRIFTYTQSGNSLNITEIKFH